MLLLRSKDSLEADAALNAKVKVHLPGTVQVQAKVKANVKHMLKVT